MKLPTFPPMRSILWGASALLLAGCGGGEKYPVPANEAFGLLSSVGLPKGLYPLPVGVHEVAVYFEPVPADNSVKWHFTHQGDDLATIFARVEPNGDKSSNVTVDYVEGIAPDGNWNNRQVRKLLRNEVQKLVVEAVDSKFDGRPFDADLRNKVTVATASASVGAMFKEVDASLDEEIERREQVERDREDRAAMIPNNSKPTTDLSNFN